MKYIFPFFKMNAANADGTNGGGSSTDNQQQQQDGGGTPSEVDQLKTQLAQEKKDRLAAAAKVTELSQAVEKLKNTNLKTQGSFKELYEQSEAKVAELETKNKTLTDSIFHTSRVSAVKDAAVKLGLRSAALSDLESLDMDDVEVKVGDDKIIRVEGASDFASRLKTLKPYLFETPKDPKFNGGGGTGGGNQGGGQVTQEMLANAHKVRNTSPEKLQAYKDMVKRFDEQTRKAKAK